MRSTFEVFEAAAAAGIGKVIFISTTSVYRPNTRYGSSKILAEQIAEDYRKNRLNMNVVTLRHSPSGQPRHLLRLRLAGRLVLKAPS